MAIPAREQDLLVIRKETMVAEGPRFRRRPQLLGRAHPFKELVAKVRRVVSRPFDDREIVRLVRGREDHELRRGDQARC